MLQSWLQDLPDDYAVKDLINEIKDWIEEGYVNSTIWKRLQNCVSPGVLPTFSERRSARKSSESSSSLEYFSATDDSDPVASVSPDVLPTFSERRSIRKHSESTCPESRREAESSAALSGVSTG